MKKNNQSENNQEKNILPQEPLEQKMENTILFPEDSSLLSAEEEYIFEEETEPLPVELSFSASVIDSDATTKRKKWIRPLTVFLVLAFSTLLIIAASWFIGNNMNERLSSPLTIKDQKINIAEFSFMYHYVLRSNGIDIYKEGSHAILDAPGENNFPTQREYFLDLTARTLQTRNILYDDATSKGYYISEPDRQMAESYILWLNQKAAELEVSTEVFIKGYFGKYVTLDTVREVLSKQYFTENYEQNHKLDELKATDAQAEAAYQEAPFQYDEISYKVLRIMFESASPSFVETANLRAQEIVERVNGDETQFEAIASEYFTGTAKESLQQEDATLLQNMRFSQVENEEWRTWLFDSSRVRGDSQIFYDNQGFPIIFLFKERVRQTEPFRDIHMIYLNREENQDASTGFSSADILPVAQSMYDAISDERSISALINAYSDEILDRKISFFHDIAAYRGIYAETIDAWVFNSERKPGDKNILETENQVIVLYYVEASSNPEWFDKVNSYIRMNNYQEFLTEKALEYPFVFDQASLSFIVGDTENNP